jgi:hypothetical protein
VVPWRGGRTREVGHNEESKREMLEIAPNHEPFETARPERLMERIIRIGSNEGDLAEGGRPGAPKRPRRGPNRAVSGSRLPDALSCGR